MELDVDPFFLFDDRGIHTLSPIIDYFWYNENGPSERPPSMFNAMSFQRRPRFDLHAVGGTVHNFT